MKAANILNQKIRDRLASNTNTVANPNGFLRHTVDEYHATCVLLKRDELTQKLDEDIAFWESEIERMKMVSTQVKQNMEEFQAK